MLFARLSRKYAGKGRPVVDDQAPELPICDVCGRQVERLETWRDEMRMKLVWVVYCHGQSERVELSFSELCEVSSGHLHVGRAFAKPPALPAAEDLQDG